LNSDSDSDSNPNSNTTIKNKKLKSMVIVFSDFRSKEWEQIIESNGGRIASSISNKTTLLVTTAKAIMLNTNSKISKANELGIRIMNSEDFENEFIN
jgi:DNA ligase (NAD+)